MKKETILYGISSIIVLIICLIIIKSSGNPEEFVRSLEASVELSNRSYTTNENFESQIITDDKRIFRPATVRMYNENIYISDFSDFSIYKYNKQGVQLDRIKTGQGRGPGEFQNLTDFDVINDKLWAVDSQNLRISSFSLDTGSFLKSISVDRRPTRITCLEDGFIIQWFGTELLFSKFDYAGNELFRFGQIIENQMRHNTTLDGTIRSNRADRFVYIPFYASLIYHYDKDGELISVLKAPDGLKFPATRREGPMFFAPDFSFYRDGYIHENNELYVYTRLPGKRTDDGEWEGDSLSVLDKYDLVTGRYEASIELPFMHSSAMFDPETSLLFTSNWEKAFKHSLGDDIDF